MQMIRIKFDLTNDECRKRLIQIGGYWIALQRYGIWNNGAQLIGCLNVPIREALENEILVYFESDECDKAAEYIKRCYPDIYY